MKFGELKSIGHNIADSLASGIGLMIGVYEMDIFGEAANSHEGYRSRLCSRQRVRREGIAGACASNKAILGSFA
jgi:hypothetical protein